MLLVCSASVFWVQSAEAQATNLRLPGGGSIAINANSASRDYDRGIIELTGNVQVVFGLQFISCDHALIHINTQELEVDGNLVMSTPMTYVEGDRAQLNYKTNTGVIFNGFVKSGQVVLQGKIIHKTGADTYEAESANFTACTTCPTAWTFRGTKIEAELGGYARIKYPILEFGGIPMLWLPYIIVPLKSERQSGLLIPSFDYSETSGASLGMTGFWAISRSQDMTLTENAYTKRGLKSKLDYRYMLSPTSFGELLTATLHDQSFAAETNGDLAPGANLGSKNNRWFLAYDHVFTLPYDIVQRVHLNLFSDLFYPRDFPDESQNTQGDPALDNRVSAWRDTEDTHTSMDVNYYVNQLHGDPTQNNDDAVHRWPAIDFSIVDRPVGNTGLLFGMSIDYVNFERDGFGWDDIAKIPNNSPSSGGTSSGNYTYMPYTNLTPPTGPNIAASPGVFLPGTDIVRTGQRLDIQPQISYPFRAGKYIDLLPSLEFRQTQYSFNVDPASGTAYNSGPYRHYLRAQLSARTSFSRVYGTDNPTPVPDPVKPQNLAIQNSGSWVDQESRKIERFEHSVIYKHEIQPEFTVTALPYNQSNSQQFFGSSQVPIFLATQPVSDSDIYTGRGLQLDYHDRLSDRNTLGFGLENKIVRKRWVNDTPEYKQIVRVRLAQSYDIDEAHQAPQASYPYSDISALIDLRFDHFETYTLFQYFPYHDVVNTSSRVRFIGNLGNFFEIDYAQTYLITETLSQANPGTRTDNLALGAGYNGKYLSFISGISINPSNYHNAALIAENGTTTAPTFQVVKGWTTLLNIKPPGNCWGIHLGIIQNIGDKPTWKVNFDYQFGGATPGANVPSASAPSTTQNNISDPNDSLASL